MLNWNNVGRKKEQSRDNVFLRQGCLDTHFDSLQQFNHFSNWTDLTWHILCFPFLKNSELMSIHPTFSAACPHLTGSITPKMQPTPLREGDLYSQHKSRNNTKSSLIHFPAAHISPLSHSALHSYKCLPTRASQSIYQWERSDHLTQKCHSSSFWSPHLSEIAAVL